MKVIIDKKEIESEVQVIDKFMCPLCEGNCDCFDAGKNSSDDEMQATIKELERKLKIADDALAAILEKDSRRDDLFNINVVFETGEIALEALKQIRGEDEK